MKHKHYDLIMAWANGAEIQCRRNENFSWSDCDHYPGWYKDYQYRVKPKPPIVRFAKVRFDRDWGVSSPWGMSQGKDHNVKVSFCPETGALLTIEKI